MNSQNENFGIPYVNKIAKNYQRHGIERMYREHRNYQADDMRWDLGKHYRH